MTRRSLIFLVIIGAVGLALGLTIYLLLADFDQIGFLPQLKLGLRTSEITPPPATGKIEDAVSALLKEIEAESALVAAGESDASLVANDSQEIVDFGLVVNENEL